VAVLVGVRWRPAHPVAGLVFWIALIAGVTELVSHNPASAQALLYVMLGSGLASSVGLHGLLRFRRRLEYRADAFAVNSLGTDAGASELFKWSNHVIHVRRRATAAMTPTRFRTHPSSELPLRRIREIARTVA
jgi:Zn-dependent protease with chaperone function